MITFYNSSSIVELTRNDLKEMLLVFEYDFNEQIEISDFNSNEKLITIGIINKLFIHFDSDTHKFHSAHSSQSNRKLDEEFDDSVYKPNKDDFKEFMIKFIEYYVQLKNKTTEERVKYAIERLVGKEKAKEYLKEIK